ncbi:MAG: type I-E CRISPR-associated protein Cas7/Cse4/CasC [Chloroflexi bacterium]|jgi:CRISPR system Cascade subunit CasC|nr:type I-E CRISPR-associated protein Cas7/Cse4/CasC [Chloroflexota bacterium]
MFIELHMVQNFAPSNLNRDDTNNPKDCTFGGTRRARISSQCIKRAIRLHPAFAEETGVEPATRTRLLAKGVMELLLKRGMPEEEAKIAAEKLTANLLGKMDSKDALQSAVLYYASPEEKSDLADIALENWETLVSEKGDQAALNKSLDNFKKKWKDRTSAPDIAMFGRMLASSANLNIDAACQVAHAISTHRVNMEYDFFTAVDDLQPKEDTGAGMMGITAFNAATFYRYAAIDFDQLVNNLGGDVDLAKKTVRGFLKASALAIPSGKQNSFAAQNPPSFLLAVVRKNSGTWSLANAFEKPINSYGETSILNASIEALDEYWKEVQGFFEDPAEPIVAMVGIDAKLKNLTGKRAATLNQWIEKVIEDIDKG